MEAIQTQPANSITFAISVSPRRPAVSSSRPSKKPKLLPKEEKKKSKDEKKSVDDLIQEEIKKGLITEEDLKETQARIAFDVKLIESF